MPDVTIKVDAEAVDDLARDIRRAKKIMIGRLAERGYQLLRAEVPVKTGNLKQGVAPPAIGGFTGKHRTVAENKSGFSVVDFEQAEASLTVSARSARTGPRQGTVYGKDGEAKKTVTLSPSAPRNYAPDVALGRPSIRPKIGRALLIPVPTAPGDEGYLIVDGQVFVFRRSAKAAKANPFHERAGGRLESEAVKIGDEVLRKIFV